MLRVNLIGAGDIKYHYFELLNIPEKEFNKHLDEIAKVLLDFEIILLPDKGVNFEVAKRYKQIGGKKAIGTVPVSDKDFGIKHMKPYIDADVDGKKIFDEIIDTENWYKQDSTLSLFGDVVLMLGNSLGSLGELVYGFYLYKLFLGAKPGVKVTAKKIHPKARAGETIPFSVIIYRPFLKEKLNYEIEAYIKRFGNIYYVNNAQELRSVLDDLSSKC